MERTPLAQSGDAVDLDGSLEYDSTLVARLAVLLHIDFPRQMKVLAVGCRRCDIVSHLGRWPMISALASDSASLAASSQPGRAFHGKWPHPLELPDATMRFHCGVTVEAEHRKQLPAEFVHVFPEMCIRQEGCTGYNPERFEIILGGFLSDTSGTDCVLLPSEGGDNSLTASITSNWASGVADWIVNLDIGRDLAGAETDAASYLEGLALRARRGLVLAWGRHSQPNMVLSLGERATTLSSALWSEWAPFESPASLASFFAAYNFTVDEAKTSSLKFFSGLACCKHHRTDLVVLTRTEVPDVPCTLRLLQQFSEVDCIYEKTFGCVDFDFIWVAQGCAGVFDRMGVSVACMNMIDGRSYSECRLAESSARSVNEESGARSQHAHMVDLPCSTTEVDTLLNHPLLTNALADAPAANAYDAMDLLVPRSGVVWEGDCHIGMLYYRLVTLALAPVGWFKDPFGVAATRRDISLIFHSAPYLEERWPHAVPVQWLRVAFALKMLAGCSKAERLPGLPTSYLDDLATRSARLAGVEDSLTSNSSYGTGFACDEALSEGCTMSFGSLRLASNTMGHYLRRLLQRLP
eukprot:TRINITY_DN23827_c0_g1_i1.p1 TRINITY_DN23827_c0_g1~~TRINITY_DN23827_c0_g1_i1.p1  ORF type:complete len:625 (+),score=45.60 TRINITY_DN23827_c0_g1_i1:138-1877(+)